MEVRIINERDQNTLNAIGQYRAIFRAAADPSKIDAANAYAGEDVGEMLIGMSNVIFYLLALINELEGNEPNDIEAPLDRIVLGIHNRN
ncbi:hypothetical protein SEA_SPARKLEGODDESS_144 [Streptomyces phage SparkleGoddess]|uniref:Uncharacterized protein n=1 Tax=Streptomyces phage SparkleGoddess TaxID=2283305 RepID=A0A345ME52_9CAUD|nr:hypothetical protein SEA_SPARKLEGODDESS_144 [Streptomyces phage SparkleGoddess]